MVGNHVSGPQIYVTCQKQIKINFQGTITIGYVLSPILLCRLDCKYINVIFFLLMALAMFALGLSFSLIEEGIRESYSQLPSIQHS